MKIVNKYQRPSGKLSRNTAIYNINQWARQNPTRVFDDSFKNQRQFLDDDTWQIILDANQNIKVGDSRYNLLPEQYRVQVQDRGVNRGTDLLANQRRAFTNLNKALYPYSLNELGLTGYRNQVNQSELDALTSQIDSLMSIRGERIEDMRDRLAKDLPQDLDYGRLYNLANEAYNRPDSGQFANYFDELQTLNNNLISQVKPLVERYQTLSEKLKFGDQNFNAKLDRAFPNFLAQLFGHNYVYDSTGKTKNYILPLKAYRGWRKYINKGNLEEPTLNGKGTNIISLSDNVVRGSNDSKQKNLLYNEYYELTNPSIYPAQQWVNNEVTSVGDNKMDPTNFSIFTGIEDGRVKTGPLSIFDSNTLIYPVRNAKKDLLPIKELNISQQNDKIKPHSFTQYYINPDLVKADQDSILARLDPNYDQDLLDKLKEIYGATEHLIFEGYMEDGDSYDINRQGREILDSIGSGLKTSISDTYAPGYWVYLSQDLDDKKNLRYIFQKYFPKQFIDNVHKSSYITSALRGIGWGIGRHANNQWSNFVDTNFDNSTSDGKSFDYIDINGNRHSLKDWNAGDLSGKTIFSNPDGGLYLSSMSNLSSEQFKYLNEYLKEHPSYMIRPDLGGFAQDFLDNPTYRQYLNQYDNSLDVNNPNLFVIGTNNSPLDINKVKEDEKER